MSLQQVSESTFASIVEVPSYMQPWPILNERRPLSLLHEKFWGKNMVDEEHQWLNAQQAMGNETAVATLDPDDDMISGCYMLDIGINALISKMWIRAEYIRIFNSINTYYDAYYDELLLIPIPRAPCVVVTGQPGIGKSVWVYYALRRCLAERKPVIWYYKGRCHLFVKEGVYEMPDDFQRAELKQFIWTLVDSDEAQEGVPSHLVPLHTPLFVIFSTSPRRGRWSRLHKTVHERRIIMNPWKRKEILRVASIYPLGRINESRTNEIFNQLGPTPRLCLEYQLDYVAMSEYEGDLRTAILEVTSNKLESLLSTAASGDLGIDPLTHKIALLSRKSSDDVYSEGVVIPITPYIQSRLSNRFRNLERKEHLRLYKAFERVPAGRKMAGVFFEALAQTALQEGITLELVPMVKLDEARKGEPRWRSSHEFFTDSQLEERRLQAFTRRSNINIQPIRTEEFPDNKSLTLVSDVMYVPEADNKVALDSFILLNDGLFIFQPTTAETHDIKQGLLDFFKKYVDPSPSWKFLFIIEPKQKLICPQPRNATLHELKMYSAVVDVKGLSVA